MKIWNALQDILFSGKAKTGLPYVLEDENTSHLCMPTICLEIYTVNWFMVVVSELGELRD